MITTADAVVSLRPGAEWTMSGDDVEGITWHTEGVEPLTSAEVLAEVKRLNAEWARLREQLERDAAAQGADKRDR